MKTLNLFILICVLGISFFSCEEEYFFYGKEIEGEFIEAEIDGQLLRTTKSSVGINSNRYSFGPINFQNDTLDQLVMIRLSDNGTESLSIFGFNLRLTETEFPLFISGDPFDPSIEPNIRLAYEQNRETDEEQIFNGQLEVIIEQWDEENYLEGSFSGTVINLSGVARQIDNGSFRIQVSRP